MARAHDPEFRGRAGAEAGRAGPSRGLRLSAASERSSSFESIEEGRQRVLGAAAAPVAAAATLAAHLDVMAHAVRLRRGVGRGQLEVRTCVAHVRHKFRVSLLIAVFTLSLGELIFVVFFAWPLTQIWPGKEMLCKVGAAAATMAATLRLGQVVQQLFNKVNDHNTSAAPHPWGQALSAAMAAHRNADIEENQMPNWPGFRDPKAQIPVHFEARRVRLGTVSECTAGPEMPRDKETLLLLREQVLPPRRQETSSAAKRSRWAAVALAILPDKKTAPRARVLTQVAQEWESRAESDPQALRSKLDQVASDVHKALKARDGAFLCEALLYCAAGLQMPGEGGGSLPSDRASDELGRRLRVGLRYLQALALDSVAEACKSSCAPFCLGLDGQFRSNSLHGSLCFSD
ncbi:unnamed protein product [Polarella glacialis]|uniref:Uncharacterized protein n=1 Tax=Polarella glacialis TaxID=89957 RepID=A0A813JK16_POLGL|nr:unnamed protein product [Polarella glacialis]